MRQLYKKFWRAEQAETLSEYSLILVLLALTAIAAVKGVGGTVDHFFTHASARVAVVSGNQSINTGPLPDDNRIDTKGPSDTKGQKSSPIS